MCVHISVYDQIIVITTDVYGNKMGTRLFLLWEERKKRRHYYDISVMRLSIHESEPIELKML